MVQEVVLTPQRPLKQSFYWHLITANFSVLLSFFVLFLCFVILRNYNHLFSIVLLSFVGLICLICSLSLSFSFVFFFFTTSGYDSNFIYKNACVLMTFNIVSVSNSIYGCTFCIYIVIYIVIDLVGINLNRSSILYVLLVRLIGGLQFKN